MPDPFLQAHEALPGFYLISYPTSPISIKDQMIRGQMILDRLRQSYSPEVFDNGRRLLVVGAGAGGATAAMRASLATRALLIDRAPDPFLVQGKATSRWIDPTQYDWPMDHWLQARYPWSAPPMPLPWQAFWSSALSLHWKGMLNRAAALSAG
jgi:hypothetical protein